MFRWYVEPPFFVRWYASFCKWTLIITFILLYAEYGNDIFNFKKQHAPYWEARCKQVGVTEFSRDKIYMIEKHVGRSCP